MTRILDKLLERKFNSVEHFNRTALAKFMHKHEPSLSDSAFNWRVHDLLDRKVLNQVKRGVYTMAAKPIYEPVISAELIDLAKIVSKEFTDLNYCIWHTEWLNDFTRHQLGTSFYIIEVERDFLEEVFHAYHTSRKAMVLLEPSLEMMHRYVVANETVVIRPLVTRSPVLKVRSFDTKVNVKVPTLEKILVDVISDSFTFHAIHGAELDNVFANALKNHSINYTKLLSYAKRRNKEMELKRYLTDNFSSLVEGLGL